ncbi:MAG: AAA family ATPase [Bacteroidales bacterium]|jgi:AAA15 family ATPase/GTPase|nr:AAA family ATPase [Bacteroidales bacterium]
MAKIYSLKITNFRGIKSFDHTFGYTDFVCIVGRGDSGKSTILEAISYVLSPSWNLTFYDTDFYKCEIDNPIEIEASLYNLPQKLLQEDKYGLYERFLNDKSGIIEDEPIDDSTQILTIKLKVERDLEPKWSIINQRQAPKEIRSRDRASLNVFLVSDFINQHFSWTKGNPLYSILKQDKEVETENNFIIDALRQAKSQIDTLDFEHLTSVVNKIKESTLSLGVNIQNTNTTIDFKDITIKDGRVCLHDNNIPFRLKGKGSKRLISIAIQITLTSLGGIILIDELEQGLEPDRVKHLTRTLCSMNRKNQGQVFITTHSQGVIEELECENLLRIKITDGILSSQFVPDNDKFQSLVRSCPEAIYASKTIVCEGKTEIGICRALDSYRIKDGLLSFAAKNVVYILGAGDGFIDKALKLKELNIDTCVFCDSDKDDKLKPTKQELREKNIQLFDWNAGNSLEKQIFEDLPWNGIKELIDYVLKEKPNLEDSIKDKFGGVLPVDWRNTDNKLMREALLKASVVKDKEWFKRIDHGEFLGSVCCRYLKDMEGKKLKSQIEGLSNWLDNA